MLKKIRDHAINTCNGYTLEFVFYNTCSLCRRKENIWAFDAKGIILLEYLYLTNMLMRGTSDTMQTDMLNTHISCSTYLMLMQFPQFGNRAIGMYITNK